MEFLKWLRDFRTMGPDVLDFTTRQNYSRLTTSLEKHREESPGEPFEFNISFSTAFKLCHRLSVTPDQLVDHEIFPLQFLMTLRVKLEKHNLVQQGGSASSSGNMAPLCTPAEGSSLLAAFAVHRDGPPNLQGCRGHSVGHWAEPPISISSDEGEPNKTPGTQGGRKLFDNEQPQNVHGRTPAWHRSSQPLEAFKNWPQWKNYIDNELTNESADHVRMATDLLHSIQPAYYYDDLPVLAEIVKAFTTGNWARCPRNQGRKKDRALAACDYYAIVKQRGSKSLEEVRGSLDDDDATIDTRKTKTEPDFFGWSEVMHYDFLGLVSSKALSRATKATPRSSGFP